MSIEKKIFQICQDESLRFNKILRISKRFALIKCRDKKNEIVLKILIKKKKFPLISFKKDLASLKFFKSHKFLGLRVPKFLGETFKTKIIAFKQEFIVGKTLQDETGFFFREIDLADLQKLVAACLALRKIKPFLIISQIPYLANFDKSYFKESLKLHQKEIKDYLNLNQQKNLKKLVDLIIKTPRFLKPKIVVHGEFYPDNFIKTKKGEIFILDWENIGLGNLWHDPCSLYLRLGKKELEKKFLKNFNPKSLTSLFNLEVILQSIGSLRYFEEKYLKRKISKKEKETGINHLSEKIYLAFQNL